MTKSEYFLQLRQFLRFTFAPTTISTTNRSGKPTRYHVSAVREAISLYKANGRSALHREACSGGAAHPAAGGPPLRTWTRPASSRAAPSSWARSIKPNVVCSSSRRAREDRGGQFKARGGGGAADIAVPSSSYALPYYVFLSLSAL